MRIQDLKGVALDWATAVATDRPVVVLAGGSYGNPNSLKYVAHPNGAPYRPTRDWAQAGMLIDEVGINLVTFADGSTFASLSSPGACCSAEGANRREAICRLVVFLKFPDGIEVPHELR